MPERHVPPIGREAMPESSATLSLTLIFAIALIAIKLVAYHL